MNLSKTKSCSIIYVCLGTNTSADWVSKGMTFTQHKFVTPLILLVVMDNWTTDKSNFPVTSVKCS